MQEWRCTIYIHRSTIASTSCGIRWMKNKEIGNQLLLWATTKRTDTARLDGSRGNWLDYEFHILLLATMYRLVSLPYVPVTTNKTITWEAIFTLGESRLNNNGIHFLNVICKLFVLDRSANFSVYPNLNAVYISFPQPH